MALTAPQLRPRLRLGVIGSSSKENEHRLPLHPEHLDRIDAGVASRIYLERGYGSDFGVSDEQLERHVAGVRSRAELIAEYTRQLVHPLFSAERGLVDDVIDPVQTRAAVARGLAMLRQKRGAAPQRKHGNVPL